MLPRPATRHSSGRRDSFHRPQNRLGENTSRSAVGGTGPVAQTLNIWTSPPKRAPQSTQQCGVTGVRAAASTTAATRSTTARRTEIRASHDVARLNAGSCVVPHLAFLEHPPGCSGHRRWDTAVKKIDQFLYAIKLQLYAALRTLAAGAILNGPPFGRCRTRAVELRGAWRWFCW